MNIPGVKKDDQSQPQENPQTPASDDSPQDQATTPTEEGPDESVGVSSELTEHQQSILDANKRLEAKINARRGRYGS